MDRDTVEDIKRHFGVVVEGLRSDFRIVAEGQDLLREDLDVLKADVLGLKDEVVGMRSRLGGVDARLDNVGRRLDGLTQIVQLTHSELTGRLGDHESRLGALERRQP